VAFHKNKKAGLTTTLKDACPKEHVAGAMDLSYEVRDKWEVPRETIKLIGVLGQGQYGEVYRGLWCAVRTAVAASWFLPGSRAHRLRWWRARARGEGMTDPEAGAASRQERHHARRRKNAQG